MSKDSIELVLGNFFAAEKAMIKAVEDTENELMEYEVSEVAATMADRIQRIYSLAKKIEEDYSDEINHQL